MAGDINQVMLVGRLTESPELRYTSNGTAVSDITLAVNRYYRDMNDERQEETSFILVTVWGRQAENCCEYLSKGSQIAMTGRLKQDKWENDSGEQRSRLKVVANNIRFLDASAEGEPPQPEGQDFMSDSSEGGSEGSDEGQAIEEESNIPF